MKVLNLTLVISIIQLVFSSSLKHEPVGQQPINYLVRFGYLDNTRTFSSNQIEEGFKKFQRVNKLPETGVADIATIKLMKKPRCGVADVFNNNTRFTVVSPEGFKKDHMNYLIKNVHPNLQTQQTKDSVKLALEIWGEYAGFTSSEVFDSKTADIKLSFEPRNHRDGYPFDGPGGTLAHAFYPHTWMRGAVHFDIFENWGELAQGDSGIDYFSVVLHELGHTFGLGHSDVEFAVMWPYYQYISKDRGLDNDDIDGMLAIYTKNNKM